MGVLKEADGPYTPTQAPPSSHELEQPSLDDRILEFIAQEFWSEGTLPSRPDNDSNA